MAKNVFRSGEVAVSSSRVFIPAPEQRMAPVTLEEPLEPEEYTGPTADDLRREAEEFKKQWDTEREKMIADAKAEAERIIEEAEQTAFEEVKKKNEQAQQVRHEAEEEAARVVQEAEHKAEQIVQQAEQTARQTESDVIERGRKEGHEQGFREGQSEVERVIERLHVILSRAIDRRKQILEESEAQIVHLVLEISKKVVKVLSENQKNIVVNNVVQALRKLKSKSDVIVRVNFADLEVTSKHMDTIIERIEHVGNITVAEDSTVDRGGCVIETDFGEIDARIASQLREIEDRILELAPIRTQHRQE